MFLICHLLLSLLWKFSWGHALGLNNEVSLSDKSLFDACCKCVQLEYFEYVFFFLTLSLKVINYMNWEWHFDSYELYPLILMCYRTAQHISDKMNPVNTLR